ncbi:MAG TPA: TolC family protein [Gemmatimonadaceae bacterium]|jgi:outer membrane protein TolC|nr:TolC family protein [Gemmatimonadaceae bacterium]
MSVSLARSAAALALLGAALATAAPQVAQAQGRPVRQLSLADAIRIAQEQSATLDLARAGVTRANGQQDQARSQFLPQVAASAAYTRTLRSQFQGVSFGSSDTTANPTVSLCSPHIAASATPAERAAALAQAQSCSQGGGFDFTKVGFGVANQYVLGLQVSQNLFTWGRLTGQKAAADAGRHVADIEYTAQRAQLALDVTQAYYDAVLAQQLVAIADSTLAQTEELLRQTKVAREVGNASEFDLLKAQVTRDNQVPAALQARSNRDVAALRLKQLLELPLDDSLDLTTRIEDAPVPDLAGIATSATPDTAAVRRAAVREAAENVRAQEGLLSVARSERYPSLSLTSGYQRLFFPTGAFPSWSDFHENWTVGLSAGVSLFSGGHTHGDVLVAQANLQQAQAQLRQVKQYAALDARVALNQLAEAEATWKASQGTVEQAQRAYAIDQVRYREGLSTQTDLAQSRLLLEQATVNRAQAARNVAVARVRMALLRDLPLTQGTSAAGTGTTGASAAGGMPQTTTQPTTTPTGSTAIPGQTGGVTP